jgi:hypothetical protein
MSNGAKVSMTERAKIVAYIPISYMQNIVIIGSASKGSNLRPDAYMASALPTELSRIM